MATFRHTRSGRRARRGTARWVSVGLVFLDLFGRPGADSASARPHFLQGALSLAGWLALGHPQGEGSPPGFLTSSSSRVERVFDVRAFGERLFDARVFVGRVSHGWPRWAIRMCEANTPR